MNNTHSASATRLRRRITSVLLTLSMIAGTIAATATPAHAASSIQGCFRSSAPGYNVNGIPVEVQAYIGNGWYKLGTITSGANGCASLPIYGSLRDYHVRMVVNYRVGSAYFSGTSRLLALPGNLPANLGPVVVTCYGCQ